VWRYLVSVPHPIPVAFFISQALLLLEASECILFVLIKLIFLDLIEDLAKIKKTAEHYPDEWLVWLKP